MELLRRVPLFVMMAALTTGCMVPGPLRNPRSLESGDQSLRLGVAGHHAHSIRVQTHFTDQIPTLAAELGALYASGLGGGLEWDLGGRALAPFDLGLLGGLKWQWLGQGRLRGLASALVVDASTLALFSPNDIGAASLWAIPLGPVDLILGGRYGWRFGDGEGGGASYERATAFLVRPPGEFWELQLAIQSAPGPGHRPYAGVSVRQDHVPHFREFSFGPQVRIEIGVELTLAKQEDKAELE